MSRDFSSCTQLLHRACVAQGRASREDRRCPHCAREARETGLPGPRLTEEQSRRRLGLRVHESPLTGTFHFFHIRIMNPSYQHSSTSTPTLAFDSCSASLIHALRFLPFSEFSLLFLDAGLLSHPPLSLVIDSHVLDHKSYFLKLKSSF